MSDFVWRFVAVFAVVVLSLFPFVLTEQVAVLFGGLLFGGSAVLALFQIGRG
jgi:hypothetical protein